MENVRRKMGWKTEFSSVWEWEENKGSGKSRRKFSLPGPQIFSTQIRRKSNERKMSQCSFTVMPSHQPFIQDLHLPHWRLLPQILITFSHLLIFTFNTPSTIPGSLLFLFFFQRNHCKNTFHPWNCEIGYYPSQWSLCQLSLI